MRKSCWLHGVNVHNDTNASFLIYKTINTIIMHSGYVEMLPDFPCLLNEGNMIKSLIAVSSLSTVVSSLKLASPRENESTASVFTYLAFSRVRLSVWVSMLMISG